MEQVTEEIEKAHVICIVFAVDRQETLNKIGSYWLPFVRESCNNECKKPIILVGNKIDLIDYSIIDVSLITCVFFVLLFTYSCDGNNLNYSLLQWKLHINFNISEHLGHCRRISWSGSLYRVFSKNFNKCFWNVLQCTESSIASNWSHIFHWRARSRLSHCYLFIINFLIMLYFNCFISLSTLQLSDKCKKALSRIFRICDIDGDGLLDDYEITHFQRKCFDTPLQLPV